MSLFEPWIGNGIFRNDKTGVEYQSLIAVWADGYATYRSGIEAEILYRNLTLIRLENVSPIREYQDDTSPQFSALVHAVHSGNPVEMGALEPFTNTDTQQNYLSVEEFPVAPLNRQSGVWPMKNVPDALYEPLFEQPSPTEAEIAQYGGLEHVPPMKTYAILDAGKFQSGLSEFEDCDLPFRCLFKGDAAEEQKDVAPYLFELSPDSPFIRRLFTHLSDMPERMTTVHMWHREPGIYLRSRVDFDDVWKHFRKFTKVQDENGKWYFLRFWEPLTIPSLVESDTADLAKALLSDGSPVGLIWFSQDSVKDCIRVCRRQTSAKAMVGSTQKLTPQALRALDQTVTERQYAHDIAATLAQLTPNAMTQRVPEREHLETSLQGLQSMGFSSADKRQTALRLYIEAFHLGKQSEAAHILNQTEQGPAIRLWHLQNLIEESHQ